VTLEEFQKELAKRLANLPIYQEDNSPLVVWLKVEVQEHAEMAERPRQTKRAMSKVLGWICITVVVAAVSFYLYTFAHIK
jgi:hypothetical protein